MHDCRGKWADLRRRLNELCIGQGVHVDIKKVEGVFELKCSGRPDLQDRERRRSVILGTAGKETREIVSEEANRVNGGSKHPADCNRGAGRE